MSNDARAKKRVVAHEEAGFCRAGREDCQRLRPWLAGSGVVFAGGMAHHFPPPLWRSALAFALLWDVGVVFNYFDEICHENTRRG